MLEVVMYCTRYCPYCVMAERYLNKKGITVEKYFIDQDLTLAQQMVKRSSGRTSVPQIFIGQQHVGGFDDLVALDRTGNFAPLLGLVDNSDSAESA